MSVQWPHARASLLRTESGVLTAGRSPGTRRTGLPGAARRRARPRPTRDQAPLWRRRRSHRAPLRGRQEPRLRPGDEVGAERPEEKREGGCRAGVRAGRGRAGCAERTQEVGAPRPRAPAGLAFTPTQGLGHPLRPGGRSCGWGGCTEPPTPCRWAARGCQTWPPDSDPPSPCLTRRRISPRLPALWPTVLWGVVIGVAAWAGLAVGSEKPDFVNVWSTPAGI